MIIDEVELQLAFILQKYFLEVDIHSAPYASIHTIRGWDSFTTLSLILEVEDRFGVTIGFASVEAIESFGDIYDLVMTKLNKAEPHFRC